MKRLKKINLLWFIAIAIILRFSVITYYGPPWFNTDSYTYFEMADAILKREPIGYFPNGYPLLIAIIKLLTPNNIELYIHIFFHFLMSTMIVFFSAQIMKNISREEILTKVTAFLVAIYPNQINYVRQLTSEVPCGFFLILGIYLLARNKYFLAGISLAVTATIRSSFSPVGLLILFIILLYPNIRKYIFRFGAGLLIAFSFYTALNKIGITKQSEILAFNLIISIRSRANSIGFFNQENLDPELMKHPIKSYLNFAISNPREFIIQRLINIWFLWGIWPDSGSHISPRKVPFKILIGLRFPLLILALLYFASKYKDFFIVCCFIPILVITLIHTAFFGGPRYTMPIEPLLIILAVLGGKLLFSNFLKTKKGELSFEKNYN